MTRIPISSDLVGLELPATTQAWTSKDTMLYALGVGGRIHRRHSHVHVPVQRLMEWHADV